MVLARANISGQRRSIGYWKLRTSSSLMAIGLRCSKRMRSSYDCMAKFIEINHPDYSDVLTLDNFWLRDHCRCNSCYNVETNQRNYNLIDISLDVKPVVTDFRDDMLYVKWDDDHESKYTFDFLYGSGFDYSVKHYEKNKKTLWDSDILSQLNYARINLGELVTNDDAISKMVRSLVEYGFAFVENVPADTEMTEMAVRRLFPVQKTFFGEMWTFTNRQDHSDTAYTRNYLGPHTDNTYFNDAAGLQVLHCIKHEGTGAETILVDGFKVLSDLKAKNTEAYEKLCTVNVPSEYIEDNQHHSYSAPIIRLNKLTNTPEQIRYNQYDRAVFNSIPQTEMAGFYRNFRELIKIVESKKYQWKFKLLPGTVLFFDNWRILHGREKYTGFREMTGCYVSRTDFMSKARVLGLVS